MNEYKKHGNGKAVVMLDKLTGELIDIYPSAFAAGIDNNVSPQNIAYVANGKRNEAAGAVWKWLSDYEREANG